MLLSVMPLPAFPTLISSTSITASAVGGEKATTNPLPEIFLGGISAKEKESIIKKQSDFVSSRKAYPASFSVIEKNVEMIKKVAQELGVPQDVAIGVALLENGGSETAVSKAGAAGIFQLMRGTAKSLGLIVNKNVDERMIPRLNIKAGITYLAKNFSTFGDWGLATWAYHAGEGNVSKAIKLYAKTNSGVTLKGLTDSKSMKAYIEKNGINVHKLLSDPTVKNFAKKLSDDSIGYPYKVMASASLFRGTN